MDLKRRVGIPAALIAVVAGIGAAWTQASATRRFFEPARLLSRFPVEDAAVISADFATLRRAGMLNEAKVAPEPDYKKFVEGTGFDYRRDLDSVTASFSASGNFYIARGRFDWKKLRAYTAQQGGSCYQDLCRMQGSTAERHISFLPLRGDAIALAVSNNDLAAARLAQAGQPVTGSIPVAPVWLSVPGSVLRRQTVLPAGLRGMFTALMNTDRVVVTLQASGKGAGAQVEARMEAGCRSTADAAVLASQLRLATATLREAFAHEKQSKEKQDDELAAMLQSGTFEESGARVVGKWPVRKTLLDSLTAGI